MEAKVSLRRIQEFLLSEEMPANYYDVDRGAQSGAVGGASAATSPHISIVNGYFRWDREQGDAVLSDINLEVSSPSLVCVVGPVGAGKSSLINVRVKQFFACEPPVAVLILSMYHLVQVFLKEIEIVSGTVVVAGRVSYASQTPFLLDATVRDNILFGKDYDVMRYKQAIDVACMSQDLDMLIAGDLTRIGERGVSLSGGTRAKYKALPCQRESVLNLEAILILSGQKARISLARAVYADADIVLLDDPLSALDSNVGNRVFTECVLKVLKNKIVVLVTHQLQYLVHADRVLALNEGKIVYSGSYSSMKDQGLDIVDLLHKFGVQEHVVRDATPNSSCTRLAVSLCLYF